MLSTWLVVIGSTVQAAGFMLALRKAAATRRAEIPEHPTLHGKLAGATTTRVRLALVRLGLRKPRVHSVGGTLSGGIRLSGSARGSVRRGGLTTEARFDALEAEVQDHRAKHADELAELQAKLDAVGQSVDEATARLEAERRQRIVSDLLWEEAGVWIFVLGLAITTGGALAA